MLSWENDKASGPRFDQYGERIAFDHDSTKAALGLGDYPFPGGSWEEYLYLSRDTQAYYDAGRLMRYDKLGFVNYLLQYRPRYAETPPLWKTPARPFHPMKNGVSQLLDYVDGLKFGDHVGLVSYDTAARWEVAVNDPAEGMVADISDRPITDDYDALDTIQRHRQAGYYQATTGLGDGVAEAHRMLSLHGRYGARPTVLMMTDGNANVSPDGWQLPGDWNWNDLTDFDGDGAADYTTDDVHKQYAFFHAREAIRAGTTVHTLSLGSGADGELMHAVAHAGGGIHIDVPGGNDAQANEALLADAFRDIAARVPPPRLMHDRD